MKDDRPFPIQQEHVREESGYMERRPSTTIPWWLAEIAYKEYVKQNGNRQSLERLAERGGFGRHELVSLIRGLSIFEPTCLCPSDGIYPGCPIHRKNSSPR